MRRAVKLFLLASLLVPSFACQQSADKPQSTFADILPGGAQLIGEPSLLDIDQDGQTEWVVFYRFDPVIDDGGRSSGPIAVAVYRAEGPPPRDLRAYPLTPREDSYLCECKCTARMKDILSERAGDELIISDKCGEKTTRVTIFGWDPDEENYLPEGHFHGTRVIVQKDEIIVDRRLANRAQVAMRSTYQARGGKTYYNSDYSQPQDTELILYPEECQDVTLSPYPDKVVIAFYHHYCDAQSTAIYFTTDAWNKLNGCTGKLCGCTQDSNEITRVQVIGCQVKENHPNRAVVTASVVCKRGSENIDNVRTEMEWILVRRDERWKLDDAKVVSQHPVMMPTASIP